MRMYSVDVVIELVTLCVNVSRQVDRIGLTKNVMHVWQCCSSKSTAILLGKEKYGMMLLSVSPVVAPFTAYIH